MPEPTSILLSQGVLGVAVIALSGTLAKVYNSREHDRKEWRAEIKELNEKRLNDSLEVNKALSELGRDISQNLQLLTEKIEISKKS